MLNLLSPEISPRKDLLGHRPGNMTYAGELSFLRRRTTRNIENSDVVVSGVPFDAATTFRPGARLGPQAIRAASVQLAEISARAFPIGFDPFAWLAVADYGDCELDSGYPQKVVEDVYRHADTLLASGALMLTFGGDHFISYPLLQAHNRRFGPLALVHFDAHVDTWQDDGERLDHGSMFLRAKREGLLDVDRSVQIGIRSFSEEDHGFTVLDAPMVHEKGLDWVLQKVHAVVGDAPAYLTFDIDCLDPAFAPGTGTPVAGGLSSAQALGLVRGLADLNFLGMDLVEVAPAYDQSDVTALVAANIAHDFVCGLAVKKRALVESGAGK